MLKYGRTNVQNVSDSQQKGIISPCGLQQKYIKSHHLTKLC